jgi:O-antigen/teichoic acid export membrane protein
MSGKAVAGLLGLVCMSLAARSLGSVGYGVLILLNGFAMTVGGIVNFPGWHAVVRYGSMALQEGDHPRLGRILRRTALIEVAAGVLALVAAWVLAPIVGPRLGWNAEAQAFAVWYAFAVFATVRSTPAGLMQLLGRFDLLALHTSVGPVVKLVGALLSLAMGWGLKGFLVTWLASAIADGVAMWVLGFIVARRRLPAGWWRRTEPVRGENPGMARFMWATNADVTFSELAGRLAPLTVGWVLGPGAAGLYAIAQRISVVFSQPALSLGQAAYAEFARDLASGRPPRALRVPLARTAAWSIAAALPLLAVAAAFGRQIATLVGGHDFSGAAAVLLWIVCARIILLPGPTISSALIALGRPGRSVQANLIGNLGPYLLLPVMLWRFGLVGAGGQLVIQAVTTMALLTIFFLRRTES